MTSINNLVKELQKELNYYQSSVHQKIEDAKQETSKELLMNVKNDSPQRRPKYKNGWKLKRTKNSIILHNTHYQLTHLLEKGHVLRNGDRFAGKPHIRPNEQRAIRAYMKRVERAVKP